MLFHMKKISVIGARAHNLKNINVDLPRDKVVVITGVSGSGKSSLAFDTIFAEGQRRYVESLSAYARQFLQVMGKPDVDSIEGLSPTISIDQKSASHNPRSTVGTVTEIHDYMRLLYARVGEPHCPKHGIKLESQTVGRIADFYSPVLPGANLRCWRRWLLTAAANTWKYSAKLPRKGLRARAWMEKFTIWKKSRRLPKPSNTP